MATHVITISASIANPTPLLVSDDEGHSATTAANDALLTTTIQTGDVVIWAIHPDCAITGINNISSEPQQVNVFSEGPAQVPGESGLWMGTVGSLAAGNIESYSIEYTVEAMGTFTQDPKLEMH